MIAGLVGLDVVRAYGRIGWWDEGMRVLFVTMSCFKSRV